MLLPARKESLVQAVPENWIDPITVPPPRPVPLGARLGVLLGSAVGQIGWLISGFGMIFFWIFGWNSELFAGLSFQGDKHTVVGRIQEVVPTGASENDVRVQAVTYTFNANDGRTYRGVAYVTGDGWRSLDGLTIDYLVDDPEVSRARGLRGRVFGSSGALVIVFPLTGLIMVLISLRGGIRANRLLGSGYLAYGKFVRNAPTGVVVSGQPLVAVTLEFRARDGALHRTVSKTTQPAFIEDEPLEMLLYDGRNPDNSVTVDSLACLPDVTPENRIVLRYPERLWRSLIMPVLTLVGHGGYLLYQLVR